MLMGAQRCQALLSKQWLGVLRGSHAGGRPLTHHMHRPLACRSFATSAGSIPEAPSRTRNGAKLLAMGVAGVGLSAACTRFMSSSGVGPVVPLDRASCEANPRVFLDVSIGGRRVGRIEIELFANVCPKTAENFRCLCTCEKGSGGSSGRGPPLWYNQIHFDCVIPGIMCQAGSYPTESIYGPTFPDEFQHGVIEHSQPMLLSMATDGPDANRAKFLITLNALPDRNGKHVVFGRVTNGDCVVKQIEAVGSASGAPQAEVKIVNCGQVTLTRERRPVL